MALPRCKGRATAVARTHGHEDYSFHDGREKRRFQTLATPVRPRLDSQCMLVVEAAPSPVRNRQVAPPALEGGDHLHTQEFLRCYSWTPLGKTAELVEGSTHLGSTVSNEHAIPDSIIQGWLALRAPQHAGFYTMPSAAVILDVENTKQPHGRVLAGDTARGMAARSCEALESGVQK